MIKVDSKVKLNMPVILGLVDAQNVALCMTAEALHTDVVQSQIMPFKGGHLQNESTFVDYKDAAQGTVSIVSNTPYARRLYFHPEYNFNTEANDFAGGKWFDDYIKGGIKEDWCNDVFAQIYKGVSGV